MLLNCDRSRMSGPRFLPSGNRLGPYFCRRFAASDTSRPFPVSVVRRFAASSADIACQAPSSTVLALAAVLMLVLGSLASQEAKEESARHRQGCTNALREVGRAIG